MRVVKTPKIAKKILRRFSWNNEHNDKTIYLTFDDGPTQGVTDRVLEILKKFNAKATFFCIGRNAEKQAELYAQILAQGHRTGNHSYSHLNGWKTNKETYLADVELARHYIDSDLFRPPYGKIKPSQSKQLSRNFKIIMWDVLSWDFDSKTSKEQCLNNVINKTERGNIVLFHDTEAASENLFYVLPEVLSKFSKKGYCFSTIK